MAGKLRHIDETEGALRITGLVGVGEQGRANRSHQTFFINGRVVRCALLTQALEAAATGLVTIGQFPLCALSVTMPAGAVDVNVHPNKLEVRFRDEAFFRMNAEILLRRALVPQQSMLNKTALEEKETLLPETEVRVIEPKQTEVSLKQTEVSFAKDALEQKQTVVGYSVDHLPDSMREFVRSIPVPDLSPIRLREGAEPAKEAPSLMEKAAGTVKEPIPEEKPIVAPKENISREMPLPAQQILSIPDEAPEQKAEAKPRLIGCFARTYLLVEWEDNLLLVDQHAAHERILYEQFKRALEKGNASQRLLAPIVAPLSPREQSILMENKPLLEAAGYELEPFGERDVRVWAVPYILGQAELKPLFLEMIDQLDQLKNAAIERRRDVVIQASCKKAVKAGDTLTQEEMEVLLQDMQETKAPPTCPHGRPVLKVFRKGEIERMFRRT